MMNNHKPSQFNPFDELFRAVKIMRDFHQPWCVCGGWAIDLYLNRVTRPHKDADFAIWRRDQLAARSYLVARGWEVQKAADGRLRPWAEGEFIELPVHTIWCRRPAAQPDFCEILFNEAHDRQFLFRRDLSITRPLAAAVIQSTLGIPILAPEIVLLYKASNLGHAGNRSDFVSALPYLGSERRAWLRRGLLKMHPGHEWLSQL